MYDPIFLTANEQEAHELDHDFAAFCDYLITDKDNTEYVYVRRAEDAVEIRPVYGSLESLTILSSGKSGAKPKRMSVSCDGRCLEVALDRGLYRVYFCAEKNPVDA